MSRCVLIAACVALSTQYSVLSTPAADWPRFRGPNGQGVAADKDLPTTWSERENLAWKVAVPAEGWSSPVVAGGKVYLTGTTDGGKRCHVLAFDAATGKLLWNKQVFEQEARRKETKNSYASPTPVVGGDTVYAVFGGGGIAAVSTTGEVRWTDTRVNFYSQHGLGASPVVYKNLLVMPFDGSSPGPDKKIGWQTPWEESFVLALDTKTGQEVWRAKRGKSRIAHSTPVVLALGGKDVLVSNAGDVLQGFDPATGERLWSVRSEGEGLVPSVVVGERTVFATPGWPKPAVRAWRWDAADPTAEPKLLWQRTKDVPMLPTPVLANGLLFTVSEKGFAACLDPKTGEPRWEERLPGSYSASPVAAGGKVYALSEQGEATVFDAAAEFNVVSRNKLPGVFQCTPAVAGGKLFIRSDKHLYCIGK
jgi:outer membrane protein assembly factor BamB